MRSTVVVLLLFLTISCYGQNYFQKKLSTNGYDEPTSLAVLSNGNIVTAGLNSNVTSGIGFGGFVSLFDSNLNLIWSKKVSIANKEIYIRKLIVQNDKLFFVGEEYFFDGFNQNSSIIGSLDANGNTLWFKNLTFGTLDNALFSIVFDNAKQRFIALGNIESGRYSNDLLVVEFDVNGNILLQKSINNTDRSRLYNMQRSTIIINDLNYYIATMYKNATTNSEFAILIKTTFDYTVIESKKIEIEEGFEVSSIEVENNDLILFGVSKRIVIINPPPMLNKEWVYKLAIIRLKENSEVDSTFYYLSRVHFNAANEDYTNGQVFLSSVIKNGNNYILGGSAENNVFNIEMSNMQINWQNDYGAAGNEKNGFAYLSNNSIYTLSKTNSFTPRGGDLYIAKTSYGTSSGITSYCSQAGDFSRISVNNFSIDSVLLSVRDVAPPTQSNVLFNGSVTYTTREFCFVEPPEVVISPTVDTMCIDVQGELANYRVFDVGQYMPGKIYNLKITFPSGDVMYIGPTLTNNFRIPPYGSQTLQEGIYNIELKACIISEIDSTELCNVATHILYVKDRKKPSLPTDTIVCINSLVKIELNPVGYNIVKWSDGSSGNIFIPTTTGYYYVITNGNCGIDTTRFKVTFRTCTTEQAPLADFSTVKYEICEGSCIDFTNESIRAQLYNWTFEGATPSYSTAISPQVICYRNEGSYNVILKARNLDGQVHTISKQIIVKSVPNIDLNNEYEICVGKPITIESSQNLLWNNTYDGYSYSFEDAGLYDVELKNECGVKKKKIKIVTVDCDCKVYIPNAFTPNNDYINDALAPLSKCNFSDFDFKIYDRWGELVFHSTDMNHMWDGYLNYQLLPQDVYVFQLNYVDKYGNKQFEKGNITLIY